MYPSKSGLLLVLSQELYPIQESILSHLDTIDIINLTKVCSGLRTLYSQSLSSQWNINARLRQFFQDPTRFRQLLRTCDGFISGKFAYDFFARSRELSHEIILYAGARHRGTIEYFLQHVEDYVKGDDNPSALLGTEYRDIPFGFQFVYVHPQHPSRRFILRFTYVSPFEAFLRATYVPAALNIITHDRALALHPNLTFIDKRTFVSSLGPWVDTYFSSALKDYEDRGWDRSRCLSVWHDHKVLDSLKQPRMLGDKHCWTMRLYPKLEEHEQIVHKSRTDIHCFRYERFRPPYGDPTWADYAKMRLHLWTERDDNVVCD